MKPIKLQYGNRKWEIRFGKYDDANVVIELWSASTDDWLQYGIIQLDKDPQSCSVSIHRNTMPYTIIRALFQVVESEIKKRGLRFELAMDD